MGSSIPTARTNLVAALQALTAVGQPLAGVQVVRSGDQRETHYHERITVENAADIVREHHLGAQRTRERYAIPVTVEILKSGSDIQAAEVRMWAVMTEVEKLVTPMTQTLTGTVDSIAVGDIPDGEVSGPTSDRQVMAAATVRLEVQAVVSFA